MGQVPGQGVQQVQGTGGPGTHRASPGAEAPKDLTKSDHPEPPWPACRLDLAKFTGPRFQGTGGPKTMCSPHRTRVVTASGIGELPPHTGTVRPEVLVTNCKRKTTPLLQGTRKGVKMIWHKHWAKVAPCTRQRKQWLVRLNNLRFVKYFMLARARVNANGDW